MSNEKRLLECNCVKPKPVKGSQHGSFLCGKDKFEWEDAIERLKIIPLKETLEKLELSYISLEDDYKEIFLDIACIMKGQTKEDAIRILECCGFHARIGLKVLEQRFLITISSKFGKLVLGMHDHIEEMGKNIVRRSHPDEPNQHSRLWIDEEIEDILANDKGTEATRCLKVDMSRGNPRIHMKGLGKMKKLEYLEVNFAYFKRFRGEDTRKNFVSDAECLDDTSCQYFSNSLKYLKCTHYPFLYLPKTFQANNLVGVDMSRGTKMIQLWEEGEEKVLKKVKFLSLHDSNLTTFDFRITPNLEWLSLTYSCNLVDLCMPVSCHKLNYLYISDSKLRTFDLGLTPNLETLNLVDCLNLEELCMPVSCHKLNYLCISNSNLKTFDLGLTPNLETLRLDKSSNLEELCMPVSCQKLKHLNIFHSKIITFDLGLTPNLEMFILDESADFVELHVSAACPNLKILSLCKSGLRSLDLELIPNLERLDLGRCNELVEINAPIGCLKKVGYLNLSGCLRFPDFVFGNRSQPKVSRSSASLRLVGESLDLCPLHPNSNPLKFQFCCDYKEYLPSSVGNIEKLISFGLCACTDFKKFSDTICSLRCLTKLKLECEVFPKDLGQLECLEELSLSSRKIKHLPDSICMLKRLKSLTVDDGDLLEKLLEDLGQLECLEKLFVSSKKIEYLPDSICMLKRLKWLYVTGCYRLGKLPEDIGQLESLEKLVLWATTIKHLPDSICTLKHLEYLMLDSCTLLEKLPEDIGLLKCLRELDITDTCISHLPQSIFGLKGLLLAASPELLQLYDFPSEIETTISPLCWDSETEN